MTHPLYTIGYEGAKPEDFVVTLKNAGVMVLLDIREVPWSRKPGFSKEPLRKLLGEHGIDYLHLQKLGNPRSKDSDHARSLARFSTHLKTDEAQDALAHAAEISLTRPACLLCFEKNPRECHRNLVAPALTALTGQKTVDLFVTNNRDQLSLL